MLCLSRGTRPWMNKFFSSSSRAHYALVPREESQAQSLDELKVRIHSLDAGTVDQEAYAFLVRDCCHLRALDEGRLVHGYIADSKFARSSYLGNLLVQMYGRCKSLVDAKRVFDGIQEPNVYSWSIMLTAFAQNGHFREALTVYQKMQLEGIGPSRVTFVSILMACTTVCALCEGVKIQSHVAELGWELDVLLATSIINLYGKCGELAHARGLFDQMEQKDAVAWNTMIASYARAGRTQEALQLFCTMNLEGERPNKSTLASVVEACASSEELVLRGQQVHQLISESGFEGDVVLVNSVLNMYGKCGWLEQARTVFNGLSNRNTVSWNIIIGAYVQNGCGGAAFQMAQRMWLDGMVPDRVTFLNTVNACENIKALEVVHARLEAEGLGTDVILGTALVNMYGKQGQPETARSIFERVTERDTVSWNAMVAAYSQNGRGREGIAILRQMDLLGVKPNKVSFTSILEVCDLGQGKLIHERVIAAGHDCELLIGTALVNMYAKCRRLDEATIIFERMKDKDMMLWTAMIGSNVDNGRAEEALQLFRRMEAEGLKANKVTLLCVVDACSLLVGDDGPSSPSCDIGVQAHDRILACGLESDNVVANSLITMYSKYKKPDDAKQVFDKLLDRDVISWNAIITACAQNEQVEGAFKLYRRMMLEGMKPDTISFLGILHAEGLLVQQTKFIHSHIVEGGYEAVDVVGTTLIDIYGKSAQLEEACSVFHKLDKDDVVCWNAMMASYAQNEATAEQALKLAEEMDAEGVKLDRVTLIIMLEACAALGDATKAELVHVRATEAGFEFDAAVVNSLVSIYGRCASLEKAQQAFQRIRDRTVVAWNALIVAYGRNGLVSETVELFREMDLEGVKPNDVSFTSILFACNHAGLVAEGARYFSYMTGDHGLVPTSDHYSSLVGLLGRAGWTKEAEELIKGMPFKAGAVEWMTLLSVCDLHSDNVEVGRRAAGQVLDLEPGCGAPYIMLCNMYRR